MYIEKRAEYSVFLLNGPLVTDEIFLYSQNAYGLIKCIRRPLNFTRTLFLLLAKKSGCPCPVTILTLVVPM